MANLATNPALALLRGLPRTWVRAISITAAAWLPSWCSYRPSLRQATRHTITQRITLTPRPPILHRIRRLMLIRTRMGFSTNPPGYDPQLRDCLNGWSLVAPNRRGVEICLANVQTVCSDSETIVENYRIDTNNQFAECLDSRSE